MFIRKTNRSSPDAESDTKSMKAPMGFMNFYKCLLLLSVALAARNIAVVILVMPAIKHYTAPSAQSGV